MKYNTLLKTLLAFIVSFPIATGLAASENAPGDFSFIVLSDTQMGFTTRDKDMSAEIESFNKAVDYINQAKPSFVVIAGDLINSPYPGKIRDSETAEFKKILSKIDKSIPVHLVIGNHELDNIPKPETLQWARQTFGKDYYSFAVGKCRFIVLNSTIICSPQKVKTETAAQKEWLLKELASIPANEKANTLIIQHHPYFLVTADEKNNYSNTPLKIRNEYLDIFRKHGIRNILCGHLHCYHSNSSMGFKQIICGPISQPLGPGKTGLMTATFSNGKFDFRFIPFTPAQEKEVPTQAK